MPPSSEHRSRGNPNVEPLAQDHVIAARVPDHTRFFFHDPNLARLPDGRLVVAAPQWGRARTTDAGDRHLRVLVSDDGGAAWDEAPALPYQEGRPFVLDGRLLMFVQEESHRDFLLVGSDDGGRSWSDAVCVLRGPVWNISTAMLERDGELLWAMDYDLPDGTYAGKVMVRFDRSRPPFDPAAWSMSPVLEPPEMPEALIGSTFQEEAVAGAVPGARTRPFVWLEPNTVEVAGHVRVFARCTIRGQAMAHVAAAMEYDVAAGRLRFEQFVPWPGGQCKFFIVHDRPAGMYWMLGNLVTNSRDYLGWGEKMQEARYRRSAGERRWLFLHYSIDCLSWFPAGCVARWPDDVHRSFMYPSAAIHGGDLVLLSRTSRDSRDQHDADLCTIHRVRDFRSLAMDLHAGGLHRTTSREARRPAVGRDGCGVSGFYR